MALRWVPAPPFLASVPHHPQPRAQVVGFPFEATASFRGGAGFGPNVLRELSESLESYSPYQDRDLEDLHLVDRGNLLWEDPLADLETALPHLWAELGRVKAQAPFTLFLGGEHTCTLAFLTPQEWEDPHLFLLVLDAHLDLRDSYQGSRYSHASWARRALELLGSQRLLIAGARSGTREEFTLARELGICSPSPQETLARLEQLPSNTRFHLSLDIDVLDPAWAMGTGNPEPLGWSVQDILQLLAHLRQRPVVSADLVEYSPPHDPGHVTGILAAFLAREMLLALA